MKPWHGITFLLTMALAASGEPARSGLVAHYFSDPINWDGHWPDGVSVPNVAPVDWTFRNYTYSRVEPLVNHLFVQRGWFSVRWRGLLDPSSASTGTPCRVSGGLNINPNHSEDNEFTLLFPDGSQITRSDLTSRYPGYSGEARWVHVKPKGNGNQNGLEIDGRPYPLQNADTVDIRAAPMNVRLYNDARNRQGRATGNWWIQIHADDAVVSSAQDAGRDSTGGAEETPVPAVADYTFEVLADDGCRLIIDGRPLIDDWRACPENAERALRHAAPISLSDGPHEIVVEYFQGQSLRQGDRDPISLYWSCAAKGVARTAVPPSALSHLPCHVQPTAAP